MGVLKRNLSPKTPMSEASSSGPNAEKVAAWLHKLLRAAVSRSASDLFLKADGPPALRIDGQVACLGDEPSPGLAMDQVARLVLGPRTDELRRAGDVDLAYELEGVGRFRVNVFRQRGAISIAFRHVPFDIPSFEQLGLPARQLAHLSEQTRGIVLVTGVTGSGKSTTLASMVDYVNDRFGRHIITIEDPIEFVHRDKKCVIEQREVGLDTPSFAQALKHVVRQSPDVILIGEMRDQETIETAINAAEIGHLVLTTLHTGTAVQTLERIVGYFPPHQHELVRTQLSSTVQGILSQQLIQRADGSGRVVVVEAMMRSPTVCDLILKNQTGRLRQAMHEDTYYGSQTYNEVLMGMCRTGAIDMEQALAASDRPQELRNEMQGLSLGKAPSGG
jgi:twitching motility protein PilT